MDLVVRLKVLVVRHVMSYDSGAFTSKLRRLGVGSGDALMVHASWAALNGFDGKPADMVGALKNAVGPSGLIVMPSLTYQNESSKSFLVRGGVMDVRRSASRMGLLSEVFRRHAGVRRSLSPTHPLLAWGERAEWFLADHDKALEPFGSRSPFGRLLDLGAKILTIDAPFSTVTFTHFIEDRIAAVLPVPLYEPEPLTGVVVDADGNRREVSVRVLSDQANALRREERLVAELEKRRLIHKGRVGNTRLLLIDCREMAACADELAASGRVFFDRPPA